MKHRTNPHWKGIILFLLPVAVLYALFFLYPLVFVYLISLVKWNGVSTLHFVGLKNYVDSFKNAIFLRALQDNFVWAFSLGVVQIFLASLVALILARKPRGWRVLRTIYFLPNVISKVAIAMLWLSIYNGDFGLLNALLNAVGLGAWQQNWLGNLTTALPAVIFQEVVYIGYFMIIILAGTMSVPESYYEAAQMDGASVWQQERFITLPLIRGILVTSITLAVAFGLRQFESTFLMTNGGPANTTMVMGLLLYVDMGSLDYGHANAIGGTLIVIGAILITLIRRVFGAREKTAEERQ
jgi:fucose transport system permease protein